MAQAGVESGALAEESEALAPMDRMALYAAPEVGDMSNPLLHKRCSQLGRNRFSGADGPLSPFLGGPCSDRSPPVAGLS